MKIEGEYIEGRERPPNNKPSCLVYCVLILACIAVGIILAVADGGGTGALAVGGSLIVAYIIFQSYVKRSEPYDDYDRDQRNIGSALSGFASKSYDRLITNMHRHQREAGEALDRAQVSFNEGAYSPFWDAIEEAASELGHFPKTRLFCPPTYQITYTAFADTIRLLPISSDI